jgi:hypothetical protein
VRCTQQAPWPRTLCAALVLRAGAGADAGVARYSDPERGVWCRPRPRPCPVLARRGGEARVWQDWHATSGSPAACPEPLSAFARIRVWRPAVRGPCWQHGWLWSRHGWLWVGDMGGRGKTWVRRRHQVPAACHLKWAPELSFTVQQRLPPQPAQTSDMPLLQAPQLGPPAASS